MQFFGQSVFRLVYQNCVSSESDMTYIEAAVTHVLSNIYQESTGTLVLGSVAILTVTGRKFIGKHESICNAPVFL
jgi:hypothetical protein